MNTYWLTRRNFTYKHFIGAIALSLSLSSTALALDLGEMEVISEPGQPFRATVRVIDIPKNASHLSVGLASKSEYSEAMIEMDPELKELEFVGIKKQKGGYFIFIESDKNMEGESLHMLLALKGPHSRVLREYVVIEEENIYSSHAQPSLVELTEVKRPRGRVELPLPYIAVAYSEPEVEVEVDEIYIKEERVGDARSIEIKETHTRKPRHEPQVYSQAQYQVREGDNLWTIAEEVQEGTDATFYQVLAALYEANPNAFINNNINQLRRGATLTIPSTTVISSTSSESVREVKAQLSAKSNGYATEPVQSAAVDDESIFEALEKGITSTSTAASKSAQLQILTPTETDEAAGTNGVESSNEAMALMNEELVQAERENEELMMRVQSLQTQINTLQEMLQVREEHASGNAPASSTYPDNVVDVDEILIIEEAGGSSNVIQSHDPAAVEMKPTEWVDSGGLWKNLTGSQWFNYLALGLGVIILLLVSMALFGRRKTMVRRKRSSPMMSEPVVEKTVKRSDIRPQQNTPPQNNQAQSTQAKPSVQTKPVVQSKPAPSNTASQTPAKSASAAPAIKAAVAARTENRAEVKPEAKVQASPQVAPKTAEKVVESHAKPAHSHGHAEEDKVAAKLDLAKAYHDLGDDDNAVSLLQEVLWEGDTKQRKSAQEWLARIDDERKI